MKFKTYSDYKKKQQSITEAAAMRINENYLEAIDNLVDDFNAVKKVIKNSTVSVMDVWLELGVKSGAIKDKDAEYILALQKLDESTIRGDSDYDMAVKYLKKHYGLEPEDIDLPADANTDEVDRLAEKHNLTKLNEAEEESDEIDPDGLAAMEKNIEIALKTVIQEIPKDLKDIADGGEIELAPNIDKEADKELNEAIGALLAGGALALPAITQILGKSIAWAGGKLDNKSIESFGKATEQMGHDLHHKYEHVLDKVLSPFTKHMEPKKREIANKIIFYSLVTILGGAGIAAAAKAAGAGHVGLAAIESGISGVKASELASVARAIIPRVIGKLVEAA